MTTLAFLRLPSPPSFLPRPAAFAIGFAAFGLGCSALAERGPEPSDALASTNVECTSTCAGDSACAASATALHRFRHAARPALPIGLTFVERRKSPLVRALRAALQPGREPHEAGYRLVGCFSSLRAATPARLDVCAPATAFLRAGQQVAVKFLVQGGKRYVFVAIDVDGPGHAFEIGGPLPDRARVDLFTAGDVATSAYPVSLAELPAMSRAAFRSLGLDASAPLGSVEALSSAAQSALQKQYDIPDEVKALVTVAAAAKIFGPGGEAVKYSVVGAMSFVQGVRNLVAARKVVGVAGLLASVLPTWTSRPVQAAPPDGLRVSECAARGEGKAFALTALPALELLRYFLEAAGPEQSDPAYRDALHHALRVLFFEELALRGTAHPVSDALVDDVAAALTQEANPGVRYPAAKAFVGLIAAALAEVHAGVVEGEQREALALYLVGRVLAASADSAPAAKSDVTRSLEDEARKIFGKLKPDLSNWDSVFAELESLIGVILDALRRGTIDETTARLLLGQVFAAIPENLDAPTLTTVKARLCRAFLYALEPYLKEYRPALRESERLRNHERKRSESEERFYRVFQTKEKQSFKDLFAALLRTIAERSPSWISLNVAAKGDRLRPLLRLKHYLAREELCPSFLPKRRSSG